MTVKTLDIFCHCIDNFGDVGVAYRFAKEFARHRADCRVRLFVDDMSVLKMFVPAIDTERSVQQLDRDDKPVGGCDDRDTITYINTLRVDDDLAAVLGVSDIMIEMFACHIPAPIMELAYDNSKLIINLEYLSTENWVPDYHLKESLLGRGTVRKFYFMPGFTKDTGGLIFNSRLEKERLCVTRNDVLSRILISQNIAIDIDDDTLIASIFTYERRFDTLISDLIDHKKNTLLLIFGEKSQRGMSSTLSRLGADHHQKIITSYQYKNIRIINMPFIPQHDYDTLLCHTDFNIVRGEDSLARAVIAAKPFIWNAYIQDDNYQLVKVRAFLEMLRPYYENTAVENAGDIIDTAETVNNNSAFNDLNAANAFVNTDNAVNAFNDYRDLMLAFNSAPRESPENISSERYEKFLKNLQLNERAVRALYYIVLHNGCLIENLCGFLDKY